MTESCILGIFLGFAMKKTETPEKREDIAQETKFAWTEAEARAVVPPLELVRSTLRFDQCHSKRLN